MTMVRGTVSGCRCSESLGLCGRTWVSRALARMEIYDSPAGSCCGRLVDRCSVYVYDVAVYGHGSMLSTPSLQACLYYLRFLLN